MLLQLDETSYCVVLIACHLAEEVVIVGMFDDVHDLASTSLLLQVLELYALIPLR